MFAQLLGIAVFFGVLFTAGMVFVVWTSRSEARRLDLTRRLGPGEAAARLRLASEIDLVGQLLGPVGRWIHMLRLRTGRPGPVAPIVAAAMVLAMLGAAGMATLLGAAASPLGLTLGSIPFLLLIGAARRRTQRATEQLPDAMDLVARAMRAGHAFSDALHLAAVDTPSPLGDELAQAAEAHRLGLDLRASLSGLIDRMPESFEVRLLVAAILLNRETGGNLIEILEQIAETIRERIVFESKVRALTAEVRMTATILALLPFGAAGLILATEPSYLQPLIVPGFGRTLAFAALVSIGAGIAVMSRLSRVEL